MTSEQTESPPQQKTDSGLFTVLVALAANALIAVAKTVVAMITGSASLVAEAAHSWADTGNEVFLFIAEKRADKPADQTHPLGYGRAAYIWTMFAGFGLFILGAGLSITHGISSLSQPEEGDPHYQLGYLMLLVAFVLESTSLMQARKEAKRGAKSKNQPLRRYITMTSNTTVRSIFFEDATAIAGLAIAGAGMALHEITGNSVYDAIGSIAIGILLAFVAIFLIRRNAAFLVGERADSTRYRQILGIIKSHQEVRDLGFLYVEYVGPERVMVVASLELVDHLSLEQAAEVLQRVEDELDARPEIERSIVSLASASDPGVHIPEEQ